jgi:Zn-dependent protease with chaperone function
MQILLALIALAASWTLTVGLLVLAAWWAWGFLPPVVDLPDWVAEMATDVCQIAHCQVPGPFVLPRAPALEAMGEGVAVVSLAGFALLLLLHLAVPLRTRVAALLPGKQRQRCEPGTPLHTLVASVSKAAGQRTPSVWWIGTPVANAFALHGAFGRAIVVTEGLLQRLDEQELRWVVGHELGHLHYRDGKSTALWAAVATWTMVVRLLRYWVLKDKG